MTVQLAESTSMAAGDLLDAHLCTPQCLLALGDDANECTCRCNGKWHGALTQMEVPGALNAARWYERYCHYGQIILDTSCPAIQPSQERKFWNLYKRDRRAASVAIQRGSKWETLCDTVTAPQPCQLSGEAHDLFKSLIAALLRAGRIRQGGGGFELCTATGVATRTEAQVIGTIFCELLVGNHDGAFSCLDALDEDGFVPATRKATP